MHRCVRCGTSYEDSDANILRGCAKCGAIFFLYIKNPEDVKHFDAVEQELQKKDTTLEKELIKEIEKAKGEGYQEEAKEEPQEDFAKTMATEGIEVELEEAAKGPEKSPAAAVTKKSKKARRARKSISKRALKAAKTKLTIKLSAADLFGVETIRVPTDGVYEINIDALMKKRPIIVLERGKVYLIHLPSVFERPIKDDQDATKPG